MVQTGVNSHIVTLRKKQTNRSYSSYSTQTYLSALNMVKQLVRRKINKSRCVLIFADENLQRNVNCLLLSGFFCLLLLSLVLCVCEICCDITR